MKPNKADASDPNPASLFSRSLDAFIDALSAPKGFFVFISAALILLYLGRVLSFPATGGDDAEQFLFSQVLAWGYDIRNPALYTWLVSAVNGIIGVSIAGIELLKFTLLWLTYVLLYLAARQVLDSGRFAALAALSPLAIYYVAWDAALGYSHSVLLMAVCAATYVVLLRLDRRGDILSYVLLGLTFAAGVQSKYGYAMFAAAFLLAFVLDEKMRSKLLNWRILVTFVVALALTAPHFLWMLEWVQAHPGGLENRLAEKFAAPGVDSHITSAALGLWDVLQSFVGFLMPMLLIMIGFFPKAFVKIPPENTTQETPEHRRQRRILGYFVVILMAMIALMVVGSGAARLRTHYMFVFILVPIYLFARIEVSPIGARAPARYGAAMAAMALIAVIVMPVKSYVDSLRCRKCALHMPYAEFAERLRQDGFRVGTIVGFYHPFDLAGNFRVHFPESRVISIKHADFIPPAPPDQESCLFIWSRNYRGNMNDFASRKMALNLKENDQVRSLAHVMPGKEGRTIRLNYILLDGKKACR